VSVKPPKSGLEFPAWARISAARVRHVEGVIGLLTTWSEELGVDAPRTARWLRAALLHDAVKDAPIDELVRLADVTWGIEKLLHGPAAAVLAERDGEADPGVLAAVRYHSVGYADWDDVGHMLYLADYLEPGRRGLPEPLQAVRELVPRDPVTALREVARLRIAHQVGKAHPLLPETVAFWNGLSCDQ
jgi:predicted HD superfamily hydrolase involved in NAD metabolism